MLFGNTKNLDINETLAVGVANNFNFQTDDEDEEEMMADDGDDGNIMTHSVTGTGNDGGLGGQASGS